MLITGTAALQFRKACQLDQKRFWEKFGTSQSGGSRYETGRAIPKPTQRLLACAMFQTETAVLMLQMNKLRSRCPAKALRRIRSTVQR